MKSIAIASMVFAYSLGFIGKSLYHIPIPKKCEPGRVIKVDPLIVEISKPQYKIFRNTILSYDTDCDQKYNLQVIIPEGKKNPIIYLVDRNKTGKYDEFYFDRKQDDVNGNEVKCKTLEDCLDMAFISKISA